MRAKEHISKEIKQALINYRDHRDNQSKVKWDKEADREHLFDLWKKYCKKNGWLMSGEAICGTFWLHFQKDGLWNTIRVDAETPNLAKYVRKDGKSSSKGW